MAQPDSGEHALEITGLQRSGTVDLVVVASVAACVPQAKLDGERGDQHVGLQARLMPQAPRKITGATARSGAIVIVINQVCQKIGESVRNGRRRPAAPRSSSAPRSTSTASAKVKKGEDVHGAQDVHGAHGAHSW